MKDELKSAAEALPASSDELQSMNDQLIASNVQLHDRVEELRAARDELRQLNETLEQRVQERTRWLQLLHDVSRGINEASSWNDALRVVLQRICESQHWQVGYVYLPERNRENARWILPAVGWLCDERFRQFHEVSERQRYERGANLPGRVFADATPLWLNDAATLLPLLPMRGDAARTVGIRSAVALPVRVEDEVMAVLELFSDEPHEPDDLLENLMNDVSAQIGEVLQRERATVRMADLIWRERQGVLHTLHDSLGQTLTGLGMLSASLRRQLAGSAPEAADIARQIAEQAQLALEQVRHVARGLFPIEIDRVNLVSSLKSLAATTESIHKVSVQVSGPESRSPLDVRVATQLYSIAQEAVTNAVKHARARAIRIVFERAGDLTRLRVVDDGVGFGNGHTRGSGLGLRIMRYRASSIGAQLSVERPPGGGTAIVCTLREAPPPETVEPA